MLSEQDILAPEVQVENDPTNGVLSDAPVEAPAEAAPKPKRMSASARFKELIIEGGRTDEEIFKICQGEFGLSDDKRSYVSWYRNWLKKNKPEIELPEKLGGTKMERVYTEEELAEREAKAAERLAAVAAKDTEKAAAKAAKAAEREAAKAAKAEAKAKLEEARAEAAKVKADAAAKNSGVVMNTGDVSEVEPCDTESTNPFLAN